jgi:hypothetical protein
LVLPLALWERTGEGLPREGRETRDEWGRLALCRDTNLIEHAGKVAYDILVANMEDAEAVVERINSRSRSAATWKSWMDPPLDR